MADLIADSIERMMYAQRYDAQSGYSLPRCRRCRCDAPENSFSRLVSAIEGAVLRGGTIVAASMTPVFGSHQLARLWSESPVRRRTTFPVP